MKDDKEGRMEHKEEKQKITEDNAKNCIEQ